MNCLTGECLSEPQMGMIYRMYVMERKNSERDLVSVYVLNTISLYLFKRIKVLKRKVVLIQNSTFKIQNKKSPSRSLNLLPRTSFTPPHRLHRLSKPPAESKSYSPGIPFQPERFDGIFKQRLTGIILEVSYIAHVEFQ